MTDLLWTVDGPIATIVLNRPDALNAMTDAMYDGIVEAVDAIEAAPDVRAVLLSGAGHRAFAAGADIRGFTSMTTAEDVRTHERRVERAFSRLESLRCPTIALIRGFATGGGAILAACCDIRIAGDDARVGIPVARTLGNCLPMPALARLAELFGPAKLTELVFTARLIDAGEALAAGFVSEVVPVAHLQERGREIATQIASHAPLTLQATKAGLRRLAASRRTIDGDDLMLRCYLSDDFHEGVRAFIEKRRPVWTGR